MKQGDAAVVAVFQPVDAGILPGNILKEKEPNDSPGQAQKIALGRPVTGHIGKPIEQHRGDRDLFAFDVPTTKDRWVLWARLRGVPGMRLVIEIRRDKTYERIAQVTAPAAGRPVVLPNLTLTPGRYYFRIRERWMGKTRHWDLDHPYLLTWKLDPLTKGMEIEPNGQPGHATPMTVGDEVSGYFGQSRDKDWYSVSFGGLPRDATIKIELDGVPGVRAVVGIYDAKGRLLIERRSRRGRGVTLRGLSLPRNEGLFLVRLAALSGFDTEARYALRISEDAVGSDAEREPNDSLPAAMPLHGASGTIDAVLESKQDKDIYRIATTKPRSLRIEARPDPRLDLALAVLNKKGRVTMKADVGRRGYPEILTNLRIGAQDRWIRITMHRKGRSVGPLPYKLTWKMTGMEKGDESEPNNRVGQANRIRPGVSARGFIYPPGDKDYYWFEFPGSLGTTLRVRIQVQGIPKVRLSIRLLDGMGNVLAQSARRSSAGPRTIEINLHVHKRYYILVQDDSGRRANDTDTYELDMTRIW